VAVFWFAVDHFMFAGYRDEADSKLQQVAQLKSENAEASVVAQNIEAYEKTLAEKNAEFDALKGRLPEQREVSAIFENVRSLIQKNSLKLLNYQTGADKPQ